VVLFTGLLKELLLHRGSAVVILSLIFPTSLTFKDDSNIIIIESQKKKGVEFVLILHVCLHSERLNFKTCSKYKFSLL